MVLWNAKNHPSIAPIPPKKAGANDHCRLALRPDAIISRRAHILGAYSCTYTRANRQPHQRMSRSNGYPGKEKRRDSWRSTNPGAG